MEAVFEKTTRGNARTGKPARLSSGDQGGADVVPRRKTPRGRRPLADVTNDSPVAGMCENTPTPPAAAAKASAAIPQEGETLLRSQVQSLLEGQIQVRLCKLNSFVYASPCSDHGGPTPANTPAAAATGAFPDPAEDDDDGSSNWSVDVNVSSPRKIVEESVQEEEAADRESPDPWAMRDCGSNFTAGGDSCDETKDDEEDDLAEVEAGDEYYSEEEGVDDDDGGDLCCGVSEISLAAEKKPLFSSFAGKHIRFKYNSDDEEPVEEEIVANPAPSPSVIVLNGLPLPTGKHQRFPEEKSP